MKNREKKYITVFGMIFYIIIIGIGVTIINYSINYQTNLLNLCKSRDDIANMLCMIKVLSISITFFIWVGVIKFFYKVTDVDLQRFARIVVVLQVISMANWITLDIKSTTLDSVYSKIFTLSVCRDIGDSEIDNGTYDMVGVLEGCETKEDVSIVIEENVKDRIFEQYIMPVKPKIVGIVTYVILYEWLITVLFYKEFYVKEKSNKEQ